MYVYLIAHIGYRLWDKSLLTIWVITATGAKPLVFMIVADGFGKTKLRQIGGLRHGVSQLPGFLLKTGKQKDVLVCF